MTPAARISAAIEVLADIETRRRPAADALKDWGLAHRFAGSGDRAAIAGLLYDALRRKASSAFMMGESTPRAALLGMLRLERKLDLGAITNLADGGRFAPSPLTDAERARLDAASLDGAPPWVAGDYPEWLDPHLAATFGDERVEEGAALAARAPLDLRVNTLKATREEAARSARRSCGRRRRGGRRWACASCSPPMPAVRRFTPSRPSSRARSKSRTKARSLRR